MCKQQQRPAAILFADLKGAFYHALLEVVGPYFSDVDLRTYFPGWPDEDRREHTTRAMANPLRAAGLSKAWTDLLRQWFTGGWFLVEGDAQPCLHDIGIKPGDTCAAAGFSLFFQQFQVVLRNWLRQSDLVTEIPLRQEEFFLTSPPMSSVALDGPTFVDDDTVLLCADSPAQLIDKIFEATRIYVETARKFGLTLNFDKGKTEVLVSWGRKGRSLVLAHEAVIHQNGALSLKIPGQVQPLRLVSEYKHVGTWVSSAASLQRDISQKVAGATTGYLQAVSTVFSKKQYTRELRIRAMQALVESRLLANAGGWADVTLSQMARLESVRSLVLRKILETSVSDERIRKMAKVPPVFALVMARRLLLAARISRKAPPALFALLQRDRSPWKRQVLLDLSRLRDSMPEKLGTLPPPAAEPEAWERLWKAYPRSWK